MASKPIQITPLALAMRTALPTPEAAFHLKPLEQALNAKTTHAASLELTPRASIPKAEDEVFKRKQQAVRAKTIQPVSLDRETRAALPPPEAASHIPEADKLAKWEHKCKGNRRTSPCELLPLETEARSALPTAEAAAHLNRAQQTLRFWAMRDGSGPIRPLRINGRLAWPVSELRRVLGVA